MKMILVISLISALLLGGCKSSKSVVQSSQPEITTNKAGMDILSALYAGENIAVSPISISSAITMVYLGSSGDTENEISEVFYLPGNTASFHKFMGKKLHAIETDTLNTLINIANGVWIDKNYEVKNTFVNQLKEYYSTNLSEVSFREETERLKANREINQWISDETKNKINDLIPNNAFTPVTRLVLVNAVYFKSEWLHPFNKENNTKGDFTAIDGQKIQTTYMNQQKFLKLLEQKNYTCLELPYKHEAYSMLFFLPKGNAGVDNVLSDMRLWVLDSLVNQRPTYVDLKVPKYTIDYKSALNQVLKDLGMGKAFTNKADFTGITSNNDLKVTDIFHGTFIDVNEIGTEAAASTGVVMGLKSAVTAQPQPFHLNRPFLFLIYDKERNETLFAGVLVNPV